MKLKDFSRINKAVSIELLQNTNIVAVGAGGAYSLYDSLARMGLGQLTVFDFDAVDEANITRQGYETNQIGKLKVEALQEHLNLVNEGTLFYGFTDNFIKMQKSELDKVFGQADLLLFLTDSFPAQAYGNKIALYYGKPAIWAGYYEPSRCSELFFSIPGVTPPCFRCAVSSRYKDQSESKNEIKASSNCNTIFHSQLLDSFIGMLAMAILHNDVPGYEYSGWFGKYWERNLIQFKVHPEWSSTEGSLFQRTFAKTEGRALNFNAIWQKITPECPPKYSYFCPDCGGTGDLRNAIKKVSLFFK